MRFKRLEEVSFQKGKKGPLKGALRIWPLGTESRRAGSTGPEGGTTALQRAAPQRYTGGNKPAGPVVPAHPETAC